MCSLRHYACSTSRSCWPTWKPPARQLGGVAARGGLCRHGGGQIDGATHLRHNWMLWRCEMRDGWMRSSLGPAFLYLIVHSVLYTLGIGSGRCCKGDRRHCSRRKGSRGCACAGVLPKEAGLNRHFGKLARVAFVCRNRSIWRHLVPSCASAGQPPQLLGAVGPSRGGCAPALALQLVEGFID